MTSVFPSVLKTAKVVPVFKNYSKLDYSNYHPISLLSNIEKMFEKLMCKRSCTFRKGIVRSAYCYHVTYAFQSESTLYICLNVKELLARNRCNI